MFHIVIVTVRKFDTFYAIQILPEIIFGSDVLLIMNLGYECGDVDSLGIIYHYTVIEKCTLHSVGIQVCIPLYLNAILAKIYQFQKLFIVETM